VSALVSFRAIAQARESFTLVGAGDMWKFTIRRGNTEFEPGP
jgi:hypothetical protein